MKEKLNIKIAPRKTFCHPIPKKYAGQYICKKNIIEIDNKLLQKDIILVLFHEFTHFVIEKILLFKIGGIGSIIPRNFFKTKITNKRIKRHKQLEEIVCNKIGRFAIKELRHFFKKISK